MSRLRDLLTAAYAWFDNTPLKPWAEEVTLELDALNVTSLVVPNLAALAALVTTTYRDGVPAYVETQQQTYVLHKGSGAAAVPSYIVLGTGTDRWERQCVAVPEYVYRDTWYVDGTLGNDESTGLSMGAALQTVGEWWRRTQGKFAEDCTLFVANPLASDRGDYAVESIAHNGTGFQFQNNFTIQGVPTVVATDVIAAVVSPAILPGHRGQVTLTTNNVLAFDGLFCELTSGVYAGATSPIGQVLAYGPIAADTAKQFSTMQFQITRDDFSWPQMPSPGDTCNLVQYPALYCTIRPFSNASIHLEKLVIQPGNGFTGPVVFAFGPDQDGTVWSCHMGVLFLINGGASLQNCYLDQWFFNYDASTGGYDYLYCFFGGNTVLFGGPTWHVVNYSIFTFGFQVGHETVGGMGGNVCLSHGVGIYGPISVINRGKLFFAIAEYTFGNSGTTAGLNVASGGWLDMSTSGGANSGYTGTVQDLQLDGRNTCLPDLLASAGLVLPAAAPLTTFAQLAAAPFNGAALSSLSGAYIAIHV